MPPSRLARPQRGRWIHQLGGMFCPACGHLGLVGFQEQKLALDLHAGVFKVLHGESPPTLSRAFSSPPCN